ncbi:MAG: DUF1292 domain-containing protein [Tenericutes bacterium]|jgi:uncharacterized protein YrzB (UPF0473 family)|nr:DUF1292 domain-containing protein [Mycoplasmatota bacterium]
MKKNTLILMDSEGNQLVCDILFTFESEETKKKYIVYTDNSNDESGNVQVYAATYEEDGDEGGDSKVNIDGNMKKMKLSEITSEKEWKIIETILGTLQDEIKKKNNSEQ